ncbi:MAG: hypothetical protein RJA61_736 [Candidatus Parcubacteria bacterium]|jgi:hypothetical protein
MDTKVKIYKANKSYNALLLVVPIILSVVFFLGDSPITTEKWIGFAVLSGMAMLIALIPFGMRLEIGHDHVTSYFLGFQVTVIQANNIQAVQYGNLLRGGLGFGKGLNIRAVINGKSKTTSVGERLYGKEAIAHAKRILEQK